MSLSVMTSEIIKFSLPAVFTIGPTGNLEALERYVVHPAGGSDGR